MEELERTLTSNEVAEMVGRRHDQVLRDIEKIIIQLGDHKNVESYFEVSTYINVQNKELPGFLLTKKGCELYSTRMTGEKGTQFAVAYIERFHDMEQHIIEQQTKLPTDPMEILALTFKAQEQTNKRVEVIESDIKDLKENQKIGADDYGYISRRINQRVTEVAKGFGKLTKEQRGSFYKDINAGVKQVTGVSARSQLREKHYQVVIDFINDWEPSTATKTIVRQMNLDLEEAI